MSFIMVLLLNDVAEINECELGTIKKSCHNCTNFPGGYSCICRPGYRVISNSYCEGALRFFSSSIFVVSYVVISDRV